MKVKIATTEISSFTRLIDFYGPEKEYEKMMYELFRFALEHESFEEFDKFERANWFFFVQTMVVVADSIIRLKDQIMKLDDKILSKMEIIKQ